MKVRYACEAQSEVGLRRVPLRVELRMQDSILRHLRRVLFARVTSRTMCLSGAMLGLSLLCSTALGQLAGGAADASSDSEDTKQRSFNLPSQKSEVNDDLADFDRHVKKGAWERAFKSLEKVLAAKPQGLMPLEKSGLMVPSQVLIRKALTDLPAEGKEAYKLFHDAEARGLISKSQEAPAGSPQEIEQLSKVYTDLFITSSGDVAADRLGDIFFEQGDMPRAIEAWRAVLQHHPASPLPRARLLAKTAIALARIARWEEVKQVGQQLTERHAGEAITLGGKQVAADEHVAALLASPEAAAAAQAGPPVDARSATDITLPTGNGKERNEALWQFRFFSPADAAIIAAMGNNWGWGMRFPISEMVPPAIADGERVYLNLLGYFIALDAKTGKLAWRSSRFHEVTQKLQQNQMISCEQYAMIVHQGTLWSVYRDPAQLGQQGQPFRIGRRDAKTGAEGWNSSTLPELQPWNMMGAPVPLGDMVVVAAVKPEQATEQYVLGIKADDGKLLWNTHVGTHQMDQSQMYYKRSAQPAIVGHGDKIYLETHAGALLELDSKTGAIVWGFQYDSEVQQNQWWWGGDQNQSLTTVGAPVVVNGILYFKGMRSKRLNAIDLAGPSIAWTRPVNQSAMIIGVDSDRLYLGGEELMAIDLKSRDLKWSTKFPLGTGWIRPLMTDHRLYQFTPRAVFEINKSNGDPVKPLFRGADLDSLGGTLQATPNLLITVSNVAITAYRLTPDASAAPAATATSENASKTSVAPPAAAADSTAPNSTAKAPEQEATSANTPPPPNERKEPKAE